MVYTLPGTTIEVTEDRWREAPALLDSLFLADGLMLSQVARLTGLEPHVIQNWVQRGFLPPPKNRRYTQRQFCRVALINALRGGFPLPGVTGILSYVNGCLDLEADDLIDDSQLYRYVLSLYPRMLAQPTAGDGVWADWCREVLADYAAPSPDAARRVAGVLRIVVTACIGQMLRERADNLWKGLREGEETS